MVCKPVEFAGPINLTSDLIADVLGRELIDQAGQTAQRIEVKICRRQPDYDNPLGVWGINPFSDRLLLHIPPMEVAMRLSQGARAPLPPAAATWP